MKKNLKITFNRLKDLQNISELNVIREELTAIKNIINEMTINEKLSNNGFKIVINKSALLKEIDQILKTRTLERTKYYLKRLVKGLTEEKTKKINDINLNRWQDYDDIISDSLWIMNKRDSSGVHNASYRGNFIPQIPNQLLKRYTKKDDWVLDPFLGSGTTLIECLRLERNGIGIELKKNIAKIASELVQKEKESRLDRDRDEGKVKIDIITGNSSKLDIESILLKNGIKKIQFILMHPPYWDIIKFSNDKNDLSNAKTIGGFLLGFGKVLDNILPFLEEKRFFSVIIGDKYSKGKLIPLSSLLMNEVLKRNCILKSIVVKNFEDTFAKRNKKKLWRYRALSGGFYVFKHEYIYIFQKTGN